LPSICEAWGVHTPAVLALRFGTGPLYRCNLYTEALLGARDGLDLWQKPPWVVMAEAARVMAQRHTAGFLLPHLTLSGILFRAGLDGGLEGRILPRRGWSSAANRRSRHGP